ncbi:MAG: DUF1854 domain-containing protein [Armatimonadetes bacterium]|nr:DUF1854 domain-containing protein [Armatimonadota bacterium]MDE2206900.1 DUF1854 domain-containing protein [Armatimonadota bacterium]
MLESTNVTVLQPADCRFYFQPEGHLRLTIRDQITWLTVRPTWFAPVTEPGRQLALLDGSDTEIGVLDRLELLAPEDLKCLQTEIRRRYLSARVERILSVRVAFGTGYWSVTTDRGDREFVTESLHENVLWYSETRLMLVDVDGNRFEIPDVDRLDALSRSRLNRMV